MGTYGTYGTIWDIWDIWEHMGAYGPKVVPKWSQSGPKVVPKWSQSGPKVVRIRPRLARSIKMSMEHTPISIPTNIWLCKIFERNRFLIVCCFYRLLQLTYFWSKHASRGKKIYNLKAFSIALATAIKRLSLPVSPSICIPKGTPPTLANPPGTHQG